MINLIDLKIHEVPWTRKSYKLIAHTDLHLIDA